jgi:hypothetical protein
MLAIACSYENGNDLDHLRSDPGFKLDCRRLPDFSRNLCSQPTMSRARRYAEWKKTSNKLYELSHEP